MCSGTFHTNHQNSYTGSVGNLFIFTGENEYLLQEERKRWSEEFVKKFGQDNFIRIDGSAISVRDLLDEVSVLPFLSEKRLVYVFGVPRCSREEATVLLSAIHPNVVLVFLDPKPDKRSAGVKELLAKAEVKSFLPMKGRALSEWMTNYARLLGCTLDVSAVQRLHEYVGDDQSLLAEEIQKLSLLQSGEALTSSDVDRLVVPTDEGIIWKISDFLAMGSSHQALHYARRMLDRGGDAQGLWSILLSWLNNLVLVRAALDAGHSSPKGIAEATGIHPFAVQSLLTYARKVPLQDLYDFLSWCAEMDEHLKTGAQRSTDDAKQELLALIDTFIIKTP